MIRDAFDEAVKASSLIKPMDAALVAAGQKVADHLDEIDSLPVDQRAKALYMVPHFATICRDLLMTPASRKAAGVTDGEAIGGKLHALRSAHKSA